ncbi:hypothetical protein [Nocardia yamanashiensis]|uniref:hypothetical protein n=1 Tax=Nocardia yamanashiensis TaxID=209247 RepID=UPI00082FD9A0|nr:hypothetical protein [Nocardia yamanashiensis]
MTGVPEVTVADTIRWLHDEGLARLAGIGVDAPTPLVAYTVEVATGIVTTFPASVHGPGTDVQAVPADDLPGPVANVRRLVVVGVTETESVLVLDLANIAELEVHADRPESTVRAWVTQLLLDPTVTIATNSPDLTINAGDRCRQTFIPGGGTIVTVDDRQPPVTTISLTPGLEAADRLEVARDGSGRLYLGERFWQLRRVLRIDDLTWAALTEDMEPEAPQYDSNPPGIL